MATLNMPRAQSIILREDILRAWISSEFNISPEMRVQCEECFLRVWKPSVLESVNDGTLSYAGKDWIIHWQSTPEVCKSSEWIAFSFRKYRGTHFVVVKSWDSAKNRQESSNVNKDEQ